MNNMCVDWTIGQTEIAVDGSPPPTIFTPDDLILDIGNFKQVQVFVAVGSSTGTAPDLKFETSMCKTRGWKEARNPASALSLAQASEHYAILDFDDSTYPLYRYLRWSLSSTNSYAVTVEINALLRR